MCLCACNVTDFSFPISCRALVFVAHGAGEHCGPYDEIGQTLKEQSLLVFAHDHGELNSLQHLLQSHRGSTYFTLQKWPILRLLYSNEEGVNKCHLSTTVKSFSIEFQSNNQNIESLGESGMFDTDEHAHTHTPFTAEEQRAASPDRHQWASIAPLSVEAMREKGTCSECFLSAAVARSPIF